MQHEPEGHTAQTKQRLLDAAVVEFARKGYEKTSLRQVCASAGLTTGALYFFFKNKDDLFRSVMRPLMRQVMEVLSEYSPDIA